MKSIDVTPGIGFLAATEDDVCNAVLQLRNDAFPGSIFVIRGRMLMSLSSGFGEISAALQFPYYFGNNWHAFDECINDPDWMPRGRCVIFFSRFDLAFIDEQDPETQKGFLLESLKRSCENWTAGLNGRTLDLTVFVCQS